MSAAPQSPPLDAARRTGRWSGIGATIGTVTGLLPHVLHHAGLLVGTALLTGIGGTALFAVLGLAAMLPMLIRLRRRFSTWWAPTIALTLFAAMFAVSTFIIGPALRGAMSGPPVDSPQPTSTPGEHTSHHR